MADGRLPDVPDEAALDALPREHPALFEAARRVAARHGFAGVEVTRFAAGSLPVFSLGGTRVLKLFPPLYAHEVEHEARVLDEVWAGLGRGDRERLVREAGAVLRAMHELDVEAVAPDGVGWRAFVEGQLAGCVERHRRLGLDEGWLSGLEEFLARCGVSERAAGRTSLLHTEVMPAHLTVVVREGKPVLAGLLDFEPARSGDPEYELASLATFWFRGDVGLWAPFVAGYGGLEEGWRRRAVAHCAVHRYGNLARYLEWIPAGAAGDWDALERAWFGG